ncbi:MAG: hypothetical protein ACK4VM_10795 [Bosea sp. (in: a-proteobacteria)]
MKETTAAATVIEEAAPLKLAITGPNVPMAKRVSASPFKYVAESFNRSLRMRFSRLASSSSHIAAPNEKGPVSGAFGRQPGQAAAGMRAQIFFFV